MGLNDEDADAEEVSQDEFKKLYVCFVAQDKDGFKDLVKLVDDICQSIIMGRRKPLNAGHWFRRAFTGSPYPEFKDGPEAGVH